jgi:hypothetical protein
MNKVTIVSFPANQVCRCGGWMNHYLKFSHRVIRMCVAVDCQDGTISGTHVQKFENEDAKIYILPLCALHAESTTEIDIRPLSIFGNANTAETCGPANFGYLKGTDL